MSFLQVENLCKTVCPKAETAWVYRKLHIYPSVYSLLAKMLSCSIMLNQMLTNLARVCKGTTTRPLWGMTHRVVKTRPRRGFSLSNLPSVTSQRADCQNCMFWKWLQARRQIRFPLIQGDLKVNACQREKDSTAMFSIRLLASQDNFFDFFHPFTLKFLLG